MKCALLAIVYVLYSKAGIVGLTMPTYFFIEPTDKAAGIKKVMDHYHADTRDVIVFGDGENDMAMFEDPWTKVAMGNAVPELKARADLVTTDVDRDGIWNACLRLGLFEN